jgi:class 3 adenylate cyclase
MPAPSPSAAIRTYAEAARRAHGITVQMRVGLNSGEVVVGTIGNDLHMDYSAVGQTTHLAARMEQLATAGSILLTADHPAAGGGSGTGHGPGAYPSAGDVRTRRGLRAGRGSRGRQFASRL